MGVASKFLMLLSTPFPLLCPSRYAVGLARYSRLALAASLPTAPSPPCSCFYGPLPVSPRRQRSSFSLRAATEFHTGTTDRVDYEQLPQTAKTAKEWPEWSRFVEHVTASEYGNMRSFLSAAATSEGDDDSFVASCDLPEGFAKAAEACLGFARERPVLLKLLSKKNVKVIVDNVTPFLFKNGLNSSSRMALYSSTEGFSLSETMPAQTVDLMRYLLSYVYSQLVSSKVGSLSVTKFLETSVNDLLNDIVNTSNPVQVSSHVNSSSSSSEQTQDIEKRRGDWICPECSHLNFARKIKCWKCDKRRPKRLPLIGEDWECPQCSYLNFARNIKCLQCEGRPKRPATGAEWECPQCDFFNSGRNLACLRCDCKRPMTASDESDRGYMRGRSFDHILSQDSDKDRNAEIGSDKMAESSHSSVLSSVGADEDFSQVMTQKGSNGLAHTTKDSGPPAEGSGRLSVNISDKCLDSSITRSLETILGQSSPASGNAHASGKNDNDSTAFVPVPSNTIRDHQSPSIQEKRLGNRVNSPEGDLRNVPFKRLQGGHRGSVPHYESSHNFDNDKESFNLSKNTSGLHDKNQTASVSNNDFPEIMPMRKGENRFVVSRKKDRSLTSPQYKKRLAMEQAGGSNFVPFVPFPPGYFARKDEPGGDETRKNQPNDTHSAANVHSYLSKNKQSSGNEYSSRNNSNNTHTDEKVANQSVKGSSGGFIGQSLEGSAVPEEPDPLDMSEEAKAQRWFRRVAQITDISELSKIPDEDFPEIMPMRKGVNRFVVSKRKTPLERRLTSPQYRRNLPTVSSDTEKD